MKTTEVGTAVTTPKYSVSFTTAKLTHVRLVKLAEVLSDQFSRGTTNAEEDLAIDLLQVAVNQYAKVTGMSHINFGGGLSEVSELLTALSRDAYEV